MVVKTNIRQGNLHVLEIPGIVLYRENDKIRVGNAEYTVIGAKTIVDAANKIIHDVEVQRWK